MEEKKQYIFGPVPSRRLGLSLGVDIVPFKACTLNCVYCQIGRTPQTTVQRKIYVPAQDVLAELQEKLSQPLNADHITISGSGEPTLNSDLGNLIDGIKKLTAIPVAIMTNGTMLFDPSVRKACAKADVVLPSLDAGDAETFEKINRHHPDITLEKLVDGLSAFRKEFQGRIWLEVFLIENVNTDPQQILAIKNIIDKISPDKVQLNTAVRPTAEPDVTRLEFEKLQKIARTLGPKAEVVADFAIDHTQAHSHKGPDEILEMLKRRPCSLDDICAGLGMTKNEAVKYLSILQNKGQIKSQLKGQTQFFIGV